MPKLNENYLNLKQSYLFSEIAHRVAAYQEKNPDKKIIRLGIGDVTRPIGSSMKKSAQLKSGLGRKVSAAVFTAFCSRGV